MPPVDPATHARVRRDLGISYAPLAARLDVWHDYRLRWTRDGCTFSVNGRPVLETRQSPSGPLGFVCWLDNQYLVATPLSNRTI